jgi:hypothetical protein
VGVANNKRLIAQLLAGQQPDGGFGVGTYSKWRGAHWRLVSLVELGISPSNRAARKAANNVLDWIASPRYIAPVINGRERRHASMEGNALAVTCRLGFARDPRTRHVVELLLRSQWPDGGWNCDVDPDAHRSSFHESLAPIWGLVEYHRATGDAESLKAARRAGELLLEHSIFRSMRTGNPIHQEWLNIHWPHYWHYDFFHGLRAVAMLGSLHDPRTEDARQLLAHRRRRDGTWGATGHRYWRRDTEVVEWGDAHDMVTPIATALLA